MKARNEFYANDYLPTDDCTVDVEYKSPIMTGLNKFSKQCATFDNLIASGDLEVGAECGTHFHFGDKSFINAETIGYVRRFYQSLFVPLCDVMQEHKAETILLFGRYFVNYASKINHNTRALRHENFINVQHDNTLEFRICKYRNAAQMMRAARLIKAMGNCIINNFILHFNDNISEEATADEITAYRKHKADITAQKLVKLYLKAIAEIEVDYTIAAEWEQTGEPHYNW